VKSNEQIHSLVELPFLIPKGTNTENYLREFKAARTNKSREIGMREFKAELK
jgi:hypothetical protein